MEPKTKEYIKAIEKLKTKLNSKTAQTSYSVKERLGFQRQVATCNQMLIKLKDDEALGEAF